MKKLLLIFSFLSTFFLTAQDKEKDKEKPKKNKTISELTKTSKKIEGLFIIYQDTVSGELKMEIDILLLGGKRLHHNLTHSLP